MELSEPTTKGRGANVKPIAHSVQLSISSFGENHHYRRAGRRTTDRFQDQENQK
jgi:hypothetical protein